MVAGGSARIGVDRSGRPVLALRERGDPGDAEREGPELPDQGPSGERRPALRRGSLEVCAQGRPADQLRRRSHERVVEGGLVGGTGEHERKPGEDEDDVGPEEVGRRVPAGRQEQEQVECQSRGRHPAGEQSRGRHQPDHDLNDRHPNAGHHRMRERERVQDEAAWGPVGEAMQLGADVGRGPGVQEAGIRELLHPGVDEGAAEEEPQREERDPGSQRRHHFPSARRSRITSPTLQRRAQRPVSGALDVSNRLRPICPRRPARAPGRRRPAG